MTNRTESTPTNPTTNRSAIGRRVGIGAIALAAMVGVPAGVVMMNQSGAGSNDEQASIRTVAAVEASARDFNVDNVHSSVIFRVKHLGVTHFFGRFNTVSGTYRLDMENPANSAIDITIDVNSVDSNNAGRDRHLKSPDFFNAPQFPNATFKATGFERAGDDTLRVTGDLTIRGTTRSVTLDVQHTGEGDRGGNFGYRGGFYAETTINRQDFGVSYLPEGLSNEVKLIISIQGIAR